jgi:hypothetical protein
MFFFSWLRNRNSNPRARRATAPRPKQARFRPLLEVLEDRAVPATLNVTTPLDVVDPNDGLLSLREAVIQAYRSYPSVTIEVPAGTYALLHGELDVSGANVTIKGAGAGATIIDGGGSSADFVTNFLDNFTGTFSSVTLSGLTIQGGHFFFGGGIANEGADLTIDHCSISGNSAVYYGGGISNENGTVAIRDSTIQGNSVADPDYSFGGGIYNGGIMTITNSIIASNSADHGGGIVNFDDLTLSNSMVSGNSAGFGGGVFSEESSLVVRGTTFLANTAVLGGGIFSSLGALTVTNSTFSGNTATANAFVPGEGGAIFTDGGTLDVRGSTFTGNSASDFGGGIYNANNGTVTLQQCTLSGNSAGSEAGGIYNASGTLTVKDSTVLNNLAPLGADIYNLGALILDDSIVGVIGP